MDTVTTYHIDSERLLVDICHGMRRTCPHGQHYTAIGQACTAQRKLAGRRGLD